MSHTPLGPGAEFAAIESLLERWGALAVDIGDDAAMLRLPRGEMLVSSVDAAFENRHFRRDWLQPEEIGYRAVTAALSDLAAMAAQPIGVLIALGVPDEWRDALPRIADGIADAVRATRTVIRGGNVTASAELSITTTVLGTAFAPLRRSTASPGDRVYVTGRLGAPGAALRRLEADRDPSAYRARFARPTARIAEARWLAAGATAAIDISDGLLGDLRHLAAASRARIVLEASAIPLADGVSVGEALESGEEYELIVTAREPFDSAAFSSRFSLALTEIGVVTQGTAGDVEVRGASVANAASHDHFSR